ncbi:MAG: hypothetical protein ACE5IM_10285 [Nitrospinota bacterium]
MNGAAHIVTSAAAGGAVGALTGSPETGAALFIAGWAIDLDHVPDFARKWGLREALVRMARMGLQQKNDPDIAVLFLHAYEVSALLWLLAALFPASPWLLGAAMGHLLHLLLDQLTNVPGWRPTYFLFYRALHRFSQRPLFGPGDERERPHIPENPPLPSPVVGQAHADLPLDRPPRRSPTEG